MLKKENKPKFHNQRDEGAPAPRSGPRRGDNRYVFENHYLQLVKKPLEIYYYIYVNYQPKI